MGSGASRHQTGQPDGGSWRPAQGHRFRHRGQRVVAGHASVPLARLDGLHGSRAIYRRHAGPPRRHLRRRGADVRDAGRQPAVLRHRRGDHVPGRLRPARVARLAHGRQPTGGIRRHSGPGAGEGAGRPHGDGARVPGGHQNRRRCRGGRATGAAAPAAAAERRRDRIAVASTDAGAGRGDDRPIVAGPAPGSDGIGWEASSACSRCMSGRWRRCSCGAPARAPSNWPRCGSVWPRRSSTTRRASASWPERLIRCRRRGARRLRGGGAGPGLRRHPADRAARREPAARGRCRQGSHRAGPLARARRQGAGPTLCPGCGHAGAVCAAACLRSCRHASTRRRWRANCGAPLGELGSKGARPC